MANKQDYSHDIKIYILTLGAAILWLGVHSHFTSTWAKANVGTKRFCDRNGTTAFGYDVCDSEAVLFEKAAKSCPSINLERYFVIMIVVTFVNSLASCAGSFRALLDAIFHGMGSVVLLISGIVYIVSALQIDDIFTWLECRGDSPESRKRISNDTVNYHKSEKVVAGILTIIQSLLYTAMAHMKTNEFRNDPKRQPVSPQVATAATQQL